MAIASLRLALSELCLFMQSDQIKCNISTMISTRLRLEEIENIQDGNDARKFPAKNADALSTISACREVVACLQPHHVKRPPGHENELCNSAKVNVLVCDRFAARYLKQMQHGP